MVTGELVWHVVCSLDFGGEFEWSCVRILHHVVFEMSRPFEFDSKGTRAVSDRLAVGARWVCVGDPLLHAPVDSELAVLYAERLIHPEQTLHTDSCTSVKFHESVPCSYAPKI